MSYVLIQKKNIPLELLKIIFTFKTILSIKPHPMCKYIKPLEIKWFGIDNYCIQPDVFNVTITIPNNYTYFFINNTNTNTNTRTRKYKVEMYKIKNIYEILSMVINYDEIMDIEVLYT
jgi:hypothetical protein